MTTPQHCSSSEPDESNIHIGQSAQTGDKVRCTITYTDGSYVSAEDDSTLNAIKRARMYKKLEKSVNN